jgi:hypothetical protein
VPCDLCCLPPISGLPEIGIKCAHEAAESE